MAEAPSDRPKPRLLVVDDEPLACRTLKVLFRGRFQVETAQSVAQARGTLSLDSFDVAIVDYHMPHETGLVLIEDLRAYLPPGRLFLMTADDALRDGGGERYTFIEKPCDPRELIKRISGLVETPPPPHDGA